MELTFHGIFNLISANCFGNSPTMTALALMVAAWAICAVICINLRAPPTYSVVPMIPIAIFFNADGVLNTTIMFIIIIVSAVTVAVGVRKAVD